MVIQGADETPAFGSFIGEVHANILHSLGAVAIVTNRAVRDLTALEMTRLQVFATRAAASPAYAHLISFGEPVEITGLKVHSADLLHGDAHGVLSIPRTVAATIPRAAAEIIERERKVVAICRSSDFSLATLGDAVHGVFYDHQPSDHGPTP